MTEVLGVQLLPTAELSRRERAQLLAPILRVLADENRLMIALLLAEHPQTVKEIQEASGLGQTLVSHHLATLRKENLVRVTPRGRANVYTLCCEQLGVPVRWLATLAALTPEGAAACCEEPSQDA